MRKLLAMIMVFLMLCGCSAAPNRDTIDAITDSTAGTDASSMMIPADVAKYDGDPIILETNWDVDYYQNTYLVPQLPLYIISCEELTQDDISVVLPNDLKCVVKIEEDDLGTLPKNISSMTEDLVAFKYETYLNYCGINWAELYEKLQKMNGATMEEGAEATTAYWNYYNQFYDDYKKLDADMLPQYRFYNVNIVPGYVTEDVTFNTLDVTVKGKTTTIDIGECRIHASSYRLDSYPVDNSENIISYDMSSWGPIPTITKSYVNCVTFIADNDMIISGYQVFPADLQYSKVRLQVNSEKGNQIDFEWDGKASIPVSEGDEVYVIYTINDPRLMKNGFLFRTWTTVFFEVEGVTYQFNSECELSHTPNRYLSFAEYCDGIDLTDYFEEYILPRSAS